MINTPYFHYYESKILLEKVRAYDAPSSFLHKIALRCMDKSESDSFFNESFRENIVRSICYNINTDSETLSLLSFSDFYFCRTYIARNPNVSEETLDYLSKDASQSIVMEVIRNSKCSESILRSIFNNPLWKSNDTVKHKLLSNNNLPLDIIEILSHHPNLYMRSRCGMHPNINEEIIERLSMDEDFLVRYNVARSPFVSDSIILKLLKDSNDEVRYAAKYVCRERGLEGYIDWLECSSAHSRWPN